MLSELSDSSFFRKSDAEEDESTAQQSVDVADDGSVDTVVDTGVDSPASQPVDQSTDEETSRHAAKPPNKQQGSLREQVERATAAAASPPRSRRQNKKRFDNSPVLSRPKSFYITKQQDADIDDIAERIEELLEGKIAHKIDRSVVVRLILESEDWTSDDAVNMLSKHLVNKLVSQLVD